MFYIDNSTAENLHRLTIKLSGGGKESAINIGFLYSALELIQNDDYYPTFEDKLTHLIWSINMNHAFHDGNKRLSITLGLLFLTLNGYNYCATRFMDDMENISYHLAAGRISKELLKKIIHSFLECEIDFSEDLKLELALTCGNGQIGFDEQDVI